MTREMLADGSHACILHPLHEAPGKHGGDVGVMMKGAVTDDLAGSGIQIQHRGKTQIHSGRE